MDKIALSYCARAKGAELALSNSWRGALRVHPLRVFIIDQPLRAFIGSPLGAFIDQPLRAFVDRPLRAFIDQSRAR